MRDPVGWKTYVWLAHLSKWKFVVVIVIECLVIVSLLALD